MESYLPIISALEAIRDEKDDGMNTATRVGTPLVKLAKNAKELNEELSQFKSDVPLKIVVGSATYKDF